MGSFFYQVVSKHHNSVYNKNSEGLYMSTWNIQTYAVSGLDVCISDITHTYTNYIVGKFPGGTFQKGSIIVDTMGLVNDAKRRASGLENPAKVPKPILLVTINNGLTDQWSNDDNGPMSRQFSMFPGTTTDRRLINNHRLGLIVDTRTGIRVDTIELRRKLELNFKFVFNTKSDLVTFKSYIYNTLPLNKANYLKGLKTSIILPNSLVHDVSRLAFDNSNFSLRDQNDLNRLTNYFNSHGTCKFRQVVEDVNNSNTWYTMERTFNNLSHIISVLEGKDGDGGDKVNEAYDKFELELNVALDFKVPNSYIMNYKVFNGPNKAIINDVYFKNVELNQNTNCPISYSKPRYIEDRDQMVPPITPNHSLIAREEFLIENATEIIQISQRIPFNSAYWLVIERATPKERKDIFDLQVFENTTFIGYDSYTVEDCGSDIIYHIKDCDTNVSFIMFLYCDLKKLAALLPILEYRVLHGIYSNVDANGKPLVVGSYPPSSDPSSVTSYGSGSAYMPIGLGGDAGIIGYGNACIFGDVTSGGFNGAQDNKDLGSIDSFNVNIVASRSDHVN